MRTIAAIILFTAASLASASAQQQGSWSMDHGHAADASAATRASAAAAKAKAAAIAAGTPLAPSQNTDFIINGSNVIRAAPALSPEQQKVEDAARAAWLTRCRPDIVEDRDGLRRTRYAAPDCDLSPYNTAGQ